jgi:NADH-quinone oxidoreductase subunit H
MRLGWRVLLPLNLLWILLLGGFRVARDTAGSTRGLLILLGITGVVAVVVLLWPTRTRTEPTLTEQVASRPPGSFPVPPIDLQVPPSPRTRRIVAERQPADTGEIPRVPVELRVGADADAEAADRDGKEV